MKSKAEITLEAILKKIPDSIPELFKLLKDDLSLSFHNRREIVKIFCEVKSLRFDDLDLSQLNVSVK